eukprot:CAMPEP_0198315398 /NCGR_PEP_ID=MMETSP1450-20131203/5686_1 /TAXON_ID=753684 ORGANISM="Madagascaria erythrocladiodes, Strain CCMP3234" /NCGR_SAMPLE_ID=MMETSP1450 /ASSEMBLY_ACC=CAM_ASM_001115 /LENGTH=226 /DNA_ID=CAMNT_0044018511 /DNA_START=17 /DNA_END=693 /DNA_ORIENTATION=+
MAKTFIFLLALLALHRPDHHALALSPSNRQLPETTPTPFETPSPTATPEPTPFETQSSTATSEPTPTGTPAPSDDNAQSTPSPFSGGEGSPSPTPTLMPDESGVHETNETMTAAPLPTPTPLPSIPPFMASCEDPGMSNEPRWNCTAEKKVTVKVHNKGRIALEVKYVNQRGLDVFQARLQPGVARKLKKACPGQVWKVQTTCGDCVTVIEIEEGMDDVEVENEVA